MRRLLIFQFLVVTIAIGQPSLADTVHYADLEGDSVFFEFISETSLGCGPLFDEPSISGDTIKFPGFGFASQAVNGDVSLINGRLDMTIRAKPGEQIESITFSEFGSLFLQGNSSAVTSSAVVNAHADGQLYTGSMLFDSAATGNSAWSDWMTLEFDQPTNEVELVFDSRLFAVAGIGDAAFIDKGGIEISVNTISQIPEPGSFGLLAIVVGLTGCRRRLR